MADGGSEKSGLGQFAKNSAKYGSASKSAYTTIESYFKHHPQTGETLQGIALKYNVTIEQIKRANNLWTNDSLFLKEFLLIPILKSPMQSPDSAISMTNGDLAMPSTSREPHVPAEIVTRREVEAASRLSRSVSRSSTRDSLASNNGVEPVTDMTPKDFLSQFDSSLSSIKDSLQKLEETTSFPEDPDNALNLLPRKKRGSKYGRTKGYSLDYSVDTRDADSVHSDPDHVTPDLMFKSRRSKSLKLKSSMDKLEQDQDDMFQL